MTTSGSLKERLELQSEGIRVGIISEPMDISHVDYCLNSLANCQRVQRVGVADPSGQVFGDARALLGKHSATLSTYDAIPRMLEDFRPDLVYVSLEAHRAPGPIEEALEAGCHVLSEKPACVRLSDFERLVRVAQKNNRMLMLVFGNRLLPQVQKARQLAQSHSLGGFYGASIHTIADQTRLESPEYQQSWYASKEKAGGGHLTWLGIHYLDLIQFITGRKIQRLCGFAGNVGGQPIDVEDSAVLSLQFENGALGTLHSAYYLDGGYQSQIVIWGSQGWLRLAGGGTFESDLEWSSTRDGGPEEVHTFPYNPEPKSTAGIQALIQAVVDATLGLREPPVAAAECLQVLKLVSGLYASAREGAITAVT